MIGKNASSKCDCTGGASTCGRQPLSLLSNLAICNDRFWIRAQYGLDILLGIRARWPNSTCILEYCLTAGAVCRLIKTPDRISERPPRGGLSVCAVCCAASVANGT